MALGVRPRFPEEPDASAPADCHSSNEVGRGASIRQPDGIKLPADDTSPKRQRGSLRFTHPSTRVMVTSLGVSLAGASGSTTQSTRIVTASARPVISAFSLLELVQWCENRAAIMEDLACQAKLPPASTRPATETTESADKPSEPVGRRAAAGSAASPSGAGRHDRIAPPNRQGGKR